MTYPPARSQTPWIWTAKFFVLLLAGASAVSPCSAPASSLRMTPIVRAVQQARPSVVNIHGRKTVRSDEELYGNSEHFRQVNGMGTGVVIDERGYIITNYHVVEGVGRIQVTLADKQTVHARLVAHDPKTDLAIIKIATDKPLPLIKIGTSSDLMPGETVIAVGNAYGYPHSVTRGIISALNRTVQVSDNQVYRELIQTDASINPGNSGGPLLNIDGEMIGINVAVRVGAQGIGFALPADEVLEVAARLLSIERLEKKVHGVVGGTRHANGDFQFVVQSIRNGTPAEQCGLKEGDVITDVDDLPIKFGLDLERALFGRSSSEPIEVTVQRNGEALKLSMELRSPNAARQSLEEKTWEILGLKLDSIPSHEFRRHSTRYRGGMRVVGVRSSGPAARQGIRSGDILVGMHIWETISTENIAYILSHDDFSQFQPMKFYILRGSETLYGHLQVSVAHRN